MQLFLTEFVLAEDGSKKNSAHYFTIVKPKLNQSSFKGEQTLKKMFLNRVTNTLKNFGMKPKLSHKIPNCFILQSSPFVYGYIDINVGILCGVHARTSKNWMFRGR